MADHGEEVLKRLITKIENMTKEEWQEAAQKAKQCKEAQMKEYGFVQRIVL